MHNSITIRMNETATSTITLKGEELFYHLTHDVNNEYSSVVALLPYAIMDRDKAMLYLESIVKDNKTLVAIYPGLGEKPTKNMKFVGSIPDGALYVK